MNNFKIFLIFKLFFNVFDKIYMSNDLFLINFKIRLVPKNPKPPVIKIFFSI